MGDDIVTKLYDSCLCCRCGCEQQCSDCEAADEIERLRVQHENWMRVAKMMISQIDQDSHAAKEYWKVIRGE